MDNRNSRMTVLELEYNEIWLLIGVAVAEELWLHRYVRFD